MDRVDERKRRLDGLRQLTPASMKLLFPRFEAEKPNFVYSTNAIEGNSLTLSETVVVLESGVTIAGKPLKDHVEALNSARAFDLMLEIAADRKPITANTMLMLHETVCAGESFAGEFRSQPVYIAGSMHVPPNHTKVRQLIVEMFETYETKTNAVHPVVSGATLHFAIANIHPFVDGNGRTARLVNNLHLIQNGYPPVLIDPVKDKPAYIQALERSDMAGVPGRSDPEAFVEYMTTIEERALKHYLYVLEEAHGIASSESLEKGRNEEGRR